jgi:hypothetical protein
MIQASAVFVDRYKRDKYAEEFAKAGLIAHLKDDDPNGNLCLFSVENPDMVNDEAIQKIMNNLDIYFKSQRN